MASLISTSERTGITAAFTDIFDTFKREIVVHKEPVRRVQQINLTNIFGYGEPSNQTNFQYVEQSQEIDADDVLPVIGVSNGQVAPDRRQRRQHRIGRQGVHRHQARA